jgi:hypothetical protein
MDEEEIGDELSKDEQQLDGQCCAEKQPRLLGQHAK